MQSRFFSSVLLWRIGTLKNTVLLYVLESTYIDTTIEQIWTVIILTMCIMTSKGLINLRGLNWTKVLFLHAIFCVSWILLLPPIDSFYRCQKAKTPSPSYGSLLVTYIFFYKFNVHSFFFFFFKSRIFIYTTLLETPLSPESGVSGDSASWFKLSWPWGVLRSLWRKSSKMVYSVWDFSDAGHPCAGGLQEIHYVLKVESEKPEGHQRSSHLFVL